MQTTYVRPPSETRSSINNSSSPATPLAPAATNASEPPPRARSSLFRVRPANQTHSDRGLIEALVNSKVFQEYEKAFTEATGLPVALRPVETWQLPHHGKRNEGPFCSLISQKSRACASCLSVQETLSELASEQAHTMGCPNGLCDTAVPVRLGDRLIGFLQTGQVFRKKPTEAQFERTARQVAEWGVDVDRQSLHEAYFGSRVVPAKQHDATVRLLTIFAQHLSMLSNQVVVQQENAEPPVITRAKEFIQEHQTENLRLGHVAKACNTSTFYFCKMFKKVTGINFTDYLSRVRIEKSKNLLLNPNLRVSEIAFEVGFQSLTHFNRVFKKILGQSPTEYRVQLLGTRI
ncbi:MAG TPA: PocR ligand-binding domain-containing protein [Patescibacteria group bacterium]|nr:PocR ligand-binding domain-containing protein [Patescibacteria group bacterium]